MQKKVMLSENILREAKDDTSNPMSGGDIEVGEMDGFNEGHHIPTRPHHSPGGSDAYRKSLQRNNKLRVELAAEGRGAGSYEFKDMDDPEVEGMPVGDVSQLPPAQKLRLIGRKTVCMAVVLTSFGIGMMVTSFFFIRRHLNDRGFLLFFLVGLCAVLPGFYACYNILGKCLGWKGFEHSLPSYDRRVT